MNKSEYIGLLMKTAVNCFPQLFVMGLTKYSNQKIVRMWTMRKTRGNRTYSGAILYANRYPFELDESFMDDMKQTVEKEWGRQWAFVGLMDIKF